MADITPTQQAELDRIRDYWVDKACQTDPVNRAEAEVHIRAAYRLAHLDEPKEVLWFDSPLAAAKHLVKLDPNARWWQYIGGNLGAGWCAMIKAYEYLGVTGLEQALGIVAVAEECGPWWPLDEVALAVDRPNVIALDAPRRDGSRPLHAEHGPALSWRDGQAVYSWHGVRVPQEAIEHPENITVRQVNAERNVEVRRALIEIMGYERWLREAKASKFHVDEYGTLWTMRVPGEDRDTKIVEVVNSSPEPDGTFKHYFLPVGDEMVRARQAIAATFGMAEHEYKPLIET